MKHECGMIQDLLPLYAERLAGEASRKAVEGHIAECENCRKALEEMGNETCLPGDAALPIKKVSRDIRNRRLRAVLLASALLLALFTALGSFITGRQYQPWSEGLASFEDKGGFLMMNIGRPGLHADVDVFPDPDRPGAVNVDVSLYTWRFAFGEGQRQIPLDVPEGKEVSVWYVQPGMENRLVYGIDPFPGGGVISLPRLALAYYLMMALALAVLLGALLFLLRRKPKGRAFAQALLGLPLCYILGHLLIKGFSTTSYYSLLRDLLWIIACAAFLYAAWLLLMRGLREKAEG